MNLTGKFEAPILLDEQLDFFVADITDSSPKCDLYLMESPLFAISSKVDTRCQRFENANGAWVEIVPSSKGRPTIHDKDLLLYTFGQIAEALNRGKPVTRRVKISAYDYLVSTNRDTNGSAYKSIGDALLRLRGTTFRSNSANSNNGEVFGLIDSGLMKNDENGRLDYVEIVISEKLFTSVSNLKNLSTYNRSYYELRSPYERRMYEICRKFCYNQTFWEIGFEKLYLRFGVISERKEFRRKLKELIKKQAIPDYYIVHRTKKETKTIEKIEVYNDKNAYMKRMDAADKQDAADQE